MQLGQIVFGTGLFLAGILSLFLSIIFFRNRLQINTRYFALFHLAAAIWAFGYLGELLVPTLSQKLFMAKIQYFGLPFVPVYSFIAFMHYISKNNFPSKKQFWLVQIVPFITLLLVCTNEFHELHYKHPHLHEVFGFYVVGKEIGPWYLIHVAYSYGILLVSATELFLLLLRNHQIFRFHSIILLISVVLPWIGNISYVFGGANSLDFTPFCFVFSGAITVWAMSGHKLFDIAPAAREKVFESMSDCIIVFDAQMQIIDMNTSAQKLFGNNCIGKSATQLHGAFPPGLMNIFEKSEGKCEIAIGENTYDVLISSLKNGRTILGGKILSSRDITQRKNTELALKEKERVLRKSEQELSEMNIAKDKFFSIIAHDLKNPFSSIIGLTAILLEEFSTTPKEELYKWLSDLKGLSFNTLKLLENLLQWSRSQTGSLQFKPAPGDMSRTAENACLALEQIAGQKIILLGSSIPKDTMVVFDEEMIGSVFRNLLGNAIKFSFPGGKVVIDFRRDSESFVFMVTDRGKGMSAERMAKLFHIEKTISERGTAGELGTGLGLLLCKEFVQKHDGEIWAESILDKGSTFCFSLPYVAVQ